MPPEHEIDGAADLGREDAQGFGFPVLALEAQTQPLAFGVVPEEERGGFGEGPLEMDVAHLGAAAGLRLAVGGAIAFDQARVGEKVLNPRKAVDGLNLVENRQRQNPADARDL